MESIVSYAGMLYRIVGLKRSQVIDVCRGWSFKIHSGKIWYRAIGTNGKYQNCRPLKHIQLALGDAYSPTDYERIHNCISAYIEAVCDLGTIEIWDNTRIAEAYLFTNYSSLHELGQLGCSCMRHGDLNDMIDNFYHKFSRARIAVLLDRDNGIMGRVLLWRNTDDDKWYHDRVYGSDKTRTRIMQYLETVDIAYLGSYPGNAFRTRFDVSKDLSDIGAPYMDHLTQCDGLYLSNHGLVSARWNLTRTDGRPEEENEYECTECGNGVDDEDCVWIDHDPYCERCVRYCADIGDYALASEAHYDSIGGEYLLDCYRDDMGNYAPEDERPVYLYRLRGLGGNGYVWYLPYESEHTLPASSMLDPRRVAYNSSMRAYVYYDDSTGRPAHDTIDSVRIDVLSDVRAYYDATRRTSTRGDINNIINERAAFRSSFRTQTNGGR